MKNLALAGGCLTLACGFALAAAAPAPLPSVMPAGELTAAQIVEKNARARGGVEAWSKIKTMAWAGHIESAAVPGREMPFLLEQQRPNQTRFEVMAQNQRSVRIYDGSNGWKLRPLGNGAPELTAYSEDELSFARDAQVIDGPLMDDAARGAAIGLIGIDAIEGRKTYRLQVTLPSGVRHRVWVDAETFLEARFERDFRNAAGRSGVASVSYRSYQAFEGLQLPTTIEMVSADGGTVNRLVIEKIALNPQLDARMFSKPDVPTTRHRGVTVDTRNPPPAGANAAPRPRH